MYQTLEPESISSLFTIILHKLAGSYTRSYSFEQLSKLVTPALNISIQAQGIAAIREKEARLLEALILLDYEGYIFLNPNNDQSTIITKGLIKVNNKEFCN